MTTDQQLAILRSALDQIAAWDDGDCPDSPAAFTARRALTEIGAGREVTPQPDGPLTWFLDDLLAESTTVRSGTLDEVIDSFSAESTTR